MNNLFMGLTGASSTVSSMTSGLNSVVTDVLAGIAAIAPVALTIFAARFVWKTGIKFFKDIGKQA